MPPGNHLTVDWVAPRCTRLLKNRLGCTNGMSKAYERDFEREFATGDTVLVKEPQEYLVQDGFTVTGGQSIDRRFNQVVVDKQKTIPIEWDTIEKALYMEKSMEEIEENILAPAMAQLAQQVDSDAATFIMEQTPNVLGQLGTDPTAYATFDNARSRLFQLGGWETRRRATMIISPTAASSFRQTAASSGGFYNIFGPRKDSDRSFRNGYIDKISGFDLYESMSLKTHTAGNWAGAVTVNGAGQTGATLNINCTSGDTFLLGDKFSIASVNAVNARTRQSIGSVRHFTVTSPLTASGSTATLNIHPSIVGPGSPYQNVNALPADTAALTLWPGTTSPNGKSGAVGAAFTDAAFAFVGIDLPMPKHEEIQSKHTDPDTGITIAIIRSFIPQTRSWLTRMDVMYGFGRMLARNASVVIAGA